MMQNHLEISLKSQFWTRSVRNLSKCRTESWRKVDGKLTESLRNFKTCPGGPIRAHIWAHKGPYGPIWAPTRTGPQPRLGPNPDPVFFEILRIREDRYVFFQKCYVSGSDGSVWQNNDGFLEISEASIHPRPAQSQKLERQIIIF